MDDRDLELVTGAFDTLLEVVGRECDYRTAQTVHWAKVDVLAILRGEWTAEKAGPSREPEAADVARCPACRQSLMDIWHESFACPTCYETFGEAEVEERLKPF